MQSRKYDHVLTLKITSTIREEIDEALGRMNDLSVETRSEFLRMAAAYALASVLQKGHTLSSSDEGTLGYFDSATFSISFDCRMHTVNQ
jgi:hypothetical protein